MDSEQFQMRTISFRDQAGIKKAEAFLQKQNLELDQHIESLIGIFEKEKLAAIGGISGNTLRSVAVNEDYQGTHVINLLMSQLISLQYQKGNTHVFIYTKPENIESFSFFGFYKIAEVDSQVALLENKPYGISDFIKKISQKKSEGTIISSLVMNSNPFTLGHLHLVEQASRESDLVHLFVVWEDQSIFSNEVRWELVKKGVSHLPNVILHKGENYVISNATFPSYFIAEKESTVPLHARLDLEIFSTYLAPALMINRRYVGEEPFSPVTKIYNDVMKNELPKRGIEVIEIPRMEVEGKPVSASRVRNLLSEGRLTEVQKLIPSSTYEFLLTSKGKEIIKKLKLESSSGL